MDALEWRIRKLEQKIIGQTSDMANASRLLDRDESIIDQLNSVSNVYNTSGSNHERFQELYKKFKDLLCHNETSTMSKLELVMSYECELSKYFNDLKALVDKSEQVLDVQRWPDVNSLNGKIDNLQNITKEQHLESVVVDKKVDELIGVYNDIITSFKRNTVVWNQKLEFYEAIEKKLDD